MDELQSALVRLGVKLIDNSESALGLLLLAVIAWAADSFRRKTNAEANTTGMANASSAMVKSVTAAGMDFQEEIAARGLADPGVQKLLIERAAETMPVKFPESVAAVGMTAKTDAGKADILDMAKRAYPEAATALAASPLTTPVIEPAAAEPPVKK